MATRGLPTTARCRDGGRAWHATGERHGFSCPSLGLFEGLSFLPWLGQLGWVWGVEWCFAKYFLSNCHVISPSLCPWALDIDTSSLLFGLNSAAVEAGSRIPTHQLVLFGLKAELLKLPNLASTQRCCFRCLSPMIEGQNEPEMSEVRSKGPGPMFDLSSFVWKTKYLLSFDLWLGVLEAPFFAAANGKDHENENNGIWNPRKAL